MVTRRRVLRTGLISAAATAGTAAALWPVLATGRPRTSLAGAAGRATGMNMGSATGSGTGTDAGSGDMTDDATTTLFDEVYRDRRIQGFGSPDPSRVRVLVDGRPLELMRRVDGSWISMANHYQPFRTPLATARGAVDVLGRAQLSTAAAYHH